MKWHTYLTVFVIGAMALFASAASASDDFGLMATRIHKASSATSQSMYSSQLHKSINAAAIGRMEQSCASKHPGSRVETFTMAGIMRLDGVFRAPTPLPTNDFTECMAKNMDSVTFPLPPGNQTGWPVAIQFDGKTGKVLYMAGDRQPALTLYRGSTRATMPWMYTPVPLMPRRLHKKCTMSVWMSVSVQGRVDEVDMGDTNCPSSMNRAVLDTAHQWIYIGTPGSHRTDSMDLRVSFIFDRTRIHVKL